MLAVLFTGPPKVVVALGTLKVPFTVVFASVVAPFTVKVPTVAPDIESPATVKVPLIDVFASDVVPLTVKDEHEAVEIVAVPFTNNWSLFVSPDTANEVINESVLKSLFTSTMVEDPVEYFSSP